MMPERNGRGTMTMGMPCGPHLHSPPAREVLAETEEHVVVRDEEGNAVRLMRDAPVHDRGNRACTIKPRRDAKIPSGSGPGAPWVSNECHSCPATIRDWSAPVRAHRRLRG
jgi:hypothetical protein